MALFGRKKTPARRVRRKKQIKLEWEQDEFLQNQLNNLVNLLEFSHVNAKRVFCYRTTGSSARAYA